MNEADACRVLISLDQYPTPDELWQRLCETTLQSALVSVYSVGTSRPSEGEKEDVDTP